MEWHDLYVATAGAAAALTGLIFVGISINLQKILAYPSLVTRASLSLILLMSILMFSVLLLIPTERQAIIGWIFIILAFGLWVWMLRSDIKILASAEKQYKSKFVPVVILDQLCTVAYLVGGGSLLFPGGNGPYWIAAAFLFSFAKAVLDAWVLLIEIMR